MSSFAPITALETHEVTNQAAEFVNRNLYLTDVALREAVQREAGPWLHERASDLGAVLGSEEVMLLGEQANRYPPELATFDRYGRRIDEARFHPSYHALMKLAMEHRLHDVAWTEGKPGGHVAHAVLAMLFSQVESGTMCPVNMTYASVPALRTTPGVSEPWLNRLIGGTYDPKLRPLGDKGGVTIGMAMTEKQGGSDVRANTTRAELIDASSGTYRLYGHKWFCSAPMCDAFLTLAQTPGGLSCFLVPRITPEGERNGIRLMRLKDKLGNKSNASSEIEYHGATAQLLGEEGRGVKVIIEMVHLTRLGCAAGSTGMMRMALAQAINHVSSRRAFQRTLIDQPLMRSVIAELILDYEAAVALTTSMARSLDRTDGPGRAYARLAVALAKYWLTKRTPLFVQECMECHGGAGYVEESILPRIYREAPLNAIWEGSGNVIALDILRTIEREPVSIEGLREEVSKAAGGNSRLDQSAGKLFEVLEKGVIPSRARWLAEEMAKVLQASLLVRHAPSEIADGFCAVRLDGDGSTLYGAQPLTMNIDAIMRRYEPTFET